MNFLQIKLTQGNINQGHFYLQDCRNFFPAASFGGKNKSLAGIPISVMFDGTGESVETDIDATKRLFRVARGQSKRFISFFSCKAGDTIYIHQDAPGYYRVSMRKPS
ncbi:hypothetical protein [Aeromonas caviae]|uniref:hypothetical protein n=1 Tax=Aeromonas caviae TaxID=648 RepID=UPI001320E04B|nr:hypothetical protein [Aeromonas caviae]MXQ72303.1 hypothetical protein [Aeromonas caviae]